MKKPMVLKFLDIKAKSTLPCVTSYLLSIGAASFLISIKVFNVAVSLSVLLWLIQFKTNTQHLKEKHFYSSYIPFGALYCLLLGGYFYTADHANALKELETKLSLVVLPFLVIFSSLNESHIKRIQFSFTLSTLGISVYCYIAVIKRWIIQEHSVLDIFTHYQYQTTYFTEPLNLHPTYLSISVSLSIFLLVALSRNKSALIKAFVVIAITFLLIVNLTLLSRGGLLAFAVSVIFVIAYEFLVNRKQPLILALTILVSIGLFASLERTIPNFKHRITSQTSNLKSLWSEYHPNNSTSLHFKSWQCSFALMRNRMFIFGYGTGDEKKALLKCYEENNWTEMVEKQYNAHNEFLSVFIRHGVFGLLVFIASLGYFLIRSYRNKNIIFFSFIVLFTIVSLFESTLSVYRGVVLFSLFSSLFLKESLTRSSEFTDSIVH